LQNFAAWIKPIIATRKEGVEKPDMIKAIAILTIGAALVGLGACAHHDTATTTTRTVTSTYAK
jgi:hypothetical protein